MIVLIVENSVPMRRVIRSFVKDVEADICECADAAEALRLYDKAPPDWVLLNLEIKDTNGIADILHIKQHWNGAKIVAVTIYDELELREAARAAGACAYVLKEDLSQLRGLVTG
jgi:DNA-binding NarL/FixJ family response regulator